MVRPLAPSRPLVVRLFTNLTFWVLLALVAAVLLGQFDPSLAVKAEPLGTWFIKLVKVFIPPIIFLTIVSGISGMSNLKKVGRIGVKSLLYFEVVTTISLAIGILMANLIQPGRIDKVGLPIQDASKYARQGAAGFSWKDFFLSNLTLQVLVLAIITGIVVSLLPDRPLPDKFITDENGDLVRISPLPLRKKIAAWLGSASKFVFRALKYVMYLAPLGAFGGMAFTIGKFGIRTLLPLGKLMLTMYSTMILFVFVVLGLILRYYKLNIWTYLRNIKEEILIVLGTSS
jgi:aerobic C4-dicarboxylate transport protein